MRKTLRFLFAVVFVAVFAFLVFVEWLLIEEDERSIFDAWLKVVTFN